MSFVAVCKKGHDRVTCVSAVGDPQRNPLPFLSASTVKFSIVLSSGSLLMVSAHLCFRL